MPQKYSSLDEMAGAMISQCSAESIAMVKEEGQDFGNRFGNPVYFNLSLIIISFFLLEACLIFLMGSGTNASAFSIPQTLPLACIHLPWQLLQYSMILWMTSVVRSDQLLMIFSGPLWSTYMLEVFAQTCSNRTGKSGSQHIQS